MSSRFSSLVFAMVGPILESIYRHPFTTGLAKGTLPRDQFLYYMQQDSLYLVDFARALALAGAKAHATQDIAMLLHFAEQAVVSERELHTFYFKQFHVTPAQEKAPACFAYTAHLLERASMGTPGEAMAALLPCFWIYRDVGKHILKQAKPDNPYMKWIETYACKEFSVLVDKAVELTDRFAENAGERVRSRMTDAFIASSRMEYCFWDDAAKLKAWPV